MKLKGELILLMEQWQSGRTFFNKIQQVRAFPWAQIGEVECLFQLEQYDQAKHKLQFMLKNPKTKLAAHDQLTRLFKREKQYKKAAAHLNEAIKQSPRNLNRQKEMVELSRLLHDFENMFNSSKTLAQQSKYSVHYHPNYFLTAIRANIDYAMTLLDERKAAKLAHQSQTMLEQLRADDRNLGYSKEADVAQARIYSLKQEKAKARKMLRPMLENNQGISEQELKLEFEASLDQAKALHEAGFFQEAEQLFEQLIEYSKQPHCSDLIREYILEETELRKDLTDSPKELNNRAVSYHDKGNFRLALKTFEMAFRLMPQSSSIALNLMQTAIESDLIAWDEKRLKTIVNRCNQTIQPTTLSDEQLNRYNRLNGMFAQM